MSTWLFTSNSVRVADIACSINNLSLAMPFQGPFFSSFSFFPILLPFSLTILFLLRFKSRTCYWRLSICALLPFRLNWFLFHIFSHPFFVIYLHHHHDQILKYVCFLLDLYFIKNFHETWTKMYGENKKKIFESLQSSLEHYQSVYNKNLWLTTHLICLLSPIVLSERVQWGAERNERYLFWSFGCLWMLQEWRFRDESFNFDAIGNFFEI